MNEQILAAIKTLTERIDRTITADEALKFTQAALNLANTKRSLGDGK